MFKSVLPNDYREINLTDNYNWKNKACVFFIPLIYILLNKKIMSQKLFFSTTFLLTIFDFMDSIHCIWFYCFYLILLISLILLILLTSYIFIKISQAINTIIKNIPVIIKTRQLNFINIINSNSMQSTLNSLLFMLNKIFIKQNTKIFFMSHVFNNVFLETFCFFNFFIIYNN